MTHVSPLRATPAPAAAHAPALALALALALSGCAGSPPRLVPSLRDDGAGSPRAPSADAAFRARPAPLAPVSADSLPALPNPQTFALDNGLRVVFVERRPFPVVAARLLIDMAALEADDVGGRRASLVANVYLSRPEGTGRTVGECGLAACTVISRAPSDMLGAMLEGVAALVTSGGAPHEVRERQLDEALRRFEANHDVLARNAQALLFGPSHPYGQPPSGEPPTLAALDGLRDWAFVPSAATLVVVGDATLEAVKREATRSFGGWKGPARSRTYRLEPPPPPPEGPRIVHFWASIDQIRAAIAARGPGRESPDIAPFLVLVDLLGGSPASVAFHHVREQLAAAYAVEGHLSLHPESSLLLLEASFQEDRAIDGLRALLDAIHAATDGEFPQDALDRAKRTFVSNWREETATDEGIAREIAGSIALGLPPESVSDLPARVVRVTAPEVRAAAQRYLAPSALRIVLAGRRMSSREVAPLGFGDVVSTDAFGRPGPAWRKPAWEERP